MNLPGTPAIFIGGKRYDGERSEQALRAAIVAAGGGDR
ncbi:MAG: DsbA family protein [Candidatus Limnocylindria bacterium]